MAKTREIRNRIKSVSSTKKITKTMEMVATVRSKRAQDRLRGALPFYNHLAEMAGRLVGAGGAALHPLFRRSEKVSKTIVLLITSDRGLCGGYNSNAIAAGRAEVRRLKEEGVDVEFHVAGRKGVSFFRFLGWDMARTHIGIDDKVKYEEIEPLALEFMSRFLAGEVDEVLVVGFHYLSSGEQKPRTFRLLPVEPPARSEEEEETGGAVEFEFMPSAASILEALIPFEVKTALFTRFLEAGTSEQIARRIAMKLATDNAEEMLKTLRQKYNRARQSQITMEISDIMGGAAAISK
ncbi:MAG: ATP synthase F1 subunit gamma [Planctomycetota bacterium]|jgi:F-type H+-transporting ATPase subunit gamma